MTTSTTGHPGITEDIETTLVRTLRQKGWELNQQLTEVLAGKDIRLEDIRIQGLDAPDRKESKEVRLRRFLDLVDRAIKRHAAGHLGLCTGCGAPLPLATLTDAPWTERCPMCSKEESLDMFR